MEIWSQNLIISSKDWTRAGKDLCPGIVYDLQTGLRHSWRKSFKLQDANELTISWWINWSITCQGWIIRNDLHSQRVSKDFDEFLINRKRGKFYFDTLDRSRPCEKKLEFFFTTKIFIVDMISFFFFCNESFKRTGEKKRNVGRIVWPNLLHKKNR